MDGSPPCGGVFNLFPVLVVLGVPIAALLASEAQQTHLYGLKIICLRATAWIEMKRAWNALISQHSNRRRKNILKLLLRWLCTSEGMHTVNVPAFLSRVSSLFSLSFSGCIKQRCSLGRTGRGRWGSLPVRDWATGVERCYRWQGKSAGSSQYRLWPGLLMVQGVELTKYF